MRRLLLQYPLKPKAAQDTIYENIVAGDMSTGIRYKPIQKKMEIDTTVPVITSSLECSATKIDNRPVTHTSSKVCANTSLGVGVIRNNALHITNLANDSILQMRPLITRKEEELVPIPSTRASSYDQQDTETSKDPSAILYVKKKEENKEQSRKIVTYSAYMNKLMNEPYQNYHLKPLNSMETYQHFEEMYFQ